jgi:integrase
MRNRSGEFGIFPRRARGTVYYYYWIYDIDGKRKYRSTGKLSYDEALKYCRSLQIKGQLFQATSYTFDTFAKDFFVYEKCPYIRNRLLRGFSYGRTWAKKQRGLLENIILPHFSGKDIRNISSMEIDNFILKLRQSDYGVKSVNHVLTAIKTVFRYAEQTGIIGANPVEGIKPFRAAIKEKGTFTREDLVRLFANPEQSGIWNSPMYFLLNCLAATTGLRLGELLALRPENITGTLIKVEHSWNRLDGLKCTKTGKNRSVPISSELSTAIEKYIDDYNIADYIFSSNGGKTPVDHKAVYKHFWAALSKIGIDQDTRKARNISFHSYRHTFNTLLLEAGVHPETVRLITGHSAAMTAHYAHLQLSNMPGILEKMAFIKQSVPDVLGIQQRRLDIL